MKSSLKKELNEIVRVICESADCEKIYLFGSYAYGTPHKDSDFDIYIVFKDGKTNPLLIMENVYINIGHNPFINKPIDILGCYKTSFDEDTMHIGIEKTVFEKGILLYDRNRKH